MKTTIDVADALLREAREVATRDQTTLKELIHEGLRRVLDERRPRPKAFRLREIAPVGGGFQRRRRAAPSTAAATASDAALAKAVSRRPEESRALVGG